MKKAIINTIIFAVILAVVVFILPQDFAFAQNSVSGTAVSTPSGNQGSSLLSQFFKFTNLPDLLNSALASIVNLAVAIAGFILGIAAYLLDVSIGLTLNIKAFVEATPAVYSVWRILRDITGLFFIFYLLYAAIQMMTGLNKGPSYASIIKNIVIAGILINFSFFIVSIGIDFSNVISQAIYNAMIPNHTVMKIDPKTNLSTVVGTAGKSNISNIFMNSLKIQQIYDINGNRLGTNVADPIKIALIGVAGVVMMLTTAVSFVIAALAFIARLVILIFLLAFSSLWFVSWIIPEVNKHFSFFQGQLFNQLIFMPAYLLLMYVALTIVNGSNILGAGRLDASAVSSAENWIMPYVLLSINFAIIIIILNLPLVVGLSMGGWATGWLGKSISKWDARKIWGDIKNKAPASVWNNTGGRMSSKLAQSEGLKNFAGKSVFGELALKGVKGAASSYDKKLDAQVKSRTEFANSLGYDERAIQKIKNDSKQLIDQEAAMERLERSRGNIAAADMHKANVESLKKQTSVAIENKKRERQASYAKRINTGSPETLFSKVARKDKVAAAKINIEIWQKQLDKKKEAVTELKKDLKQVEVDIRREQAAGRQASPTNLNAKSTIEAKIRDATRYSGTHNNDVNLMGVDDLQDLIDETKLIR